MIIQKHLLTTRVLTNGESALRDLEQSRIWLPRRVLKQGESSRPLLVRSAVRIQAERAFRRQGIWDLRVWTSRWNHPW